MNGGLVPTKSDNNTGNMFLNAKHTVVFEALGAHR